VLAVDHLTKRFGERVAVDAVSFGVAAGEVFGFSARTAPARRRRSACWGL
jgi:ABC-type multidrug transport system ATPase subunit